MIFILITERVMSRVDSTCDYKMHYTKYVSVTAHFLSQGRPYMITNKRENM